MQVLQQQNGNKGSFYIEKDKQRLAEMTYTLPVPGKMIIDHTEVSDELRGQQAGYMLLLEAVKFARNQQLKIIPLCPFANATFKKRPELQDVLVNN